jgi:RHS repeat-associated protein
MIWRVILFWWLLGANFAFATFVPFDAANPLTFTISPLGRSNSVAFNHQGLVSLATDQLGQPTHFYYDAKGRLTNRTDNLATTAYGHDFNDNLTGVTEGSRSNVWTYDAYNRVTTYQDVNGYTIQYRYDANGNLTNLVYPGGRNVYYAYDRLNRLTNVTDWSSRKTALTYDLDSHLTGITRPNGSFRTISYDAAGQVTNIWEQMANSLPIAWFRMNWTNSGTMAWEFAAPLPHTNTPPLRKMSYDADNRLATFQGPTMGSAQNVTMDLDGNLISGPVTSDTFTNYTYDARNRLLNAGGVTNSYDALNNRIGQTVGTNTTTYVVNPNAKLPQVLMRVKNGVITYYIYGAGLMYQITEAATGTNTLTYHYDYRGSTIALSADSGLITDRLEYSLYGSTTYRAGTNDTPFLYNGRYGVQTDANGLLYMGARYYNPYLCRFINPDPSGFKGGLNFYAYANGNPVSYLDPFGLNAQATGDSFGTWLDNIVSSLFDNGVPNQQQISAAIVDNAISALIPTAAPEDQRPMAYSLNAYDPNGAAPLWANLTMLSTAMLGLPENAAESGSLPEANAAEGTATQMEFPFVNDVSGKPPIQWPPNGGFAGDPAAATLVPDTTIDRFGLANGSYVSPTGTPFIQRSLAPGTQYAPYNIYTVLKPIDVQAGPIAPAFGMPGGGMQFKLPSSVQSLIDSGHLGLGN